MRRWISALLLLVSLTGCVMLHADSRKEVAYHTHTPEPIIAVLTDYGTDDFYVGVLEGAIYTVNPRARVSTITNEVRAFDIAEGSYILARAAWEYPPGTVFVCIVDPGVGTKRRSIALETPDGKRFVGPDNGLMTGVMDQMGVATIHEITNTRYMRPSGRSSTFHGRDVYGPAAAHLAAGVATADLGPAIDDPVRLPMRPPRAEGESLVGTIVHVDRYGNLITNIPAHMSQSLGWRLGERFVAAMDDRMAVASFARTYGDVAEGQFVLVVNAEGVLEIARNLASAAETLHVVAGEPVVIKRQTNP